MADIKRNITSITDLKLGSSDVNYVYRATSLVWQRASAPVNYDIINFYTTVTFNSLTSDQSKYSTTVNLKL